MVSLTSDADAAQMDEFHRELQATLGRVTELSADAVARLTALRAAATRERDA